MKTVVESLKTIMKESTGVAGYHLNGELATWEELLDGPLAPVADLIDQYHEAEMTQLQKHHRDEMEKSGHQMDVLKSEILKLQDSLHQKTEELRKLIQYHRACWVFSQSRES